MLLHKIVSWLNFVSSTVHFGQMVGKSWLPDLPILFNEKVPSGPVARVPVLGLGTSLVSHAGK